MNAMEMLKEMFPSSDGFSVGLFRAEYRDDIYSIKWKEIYLPAVKVYKNGLVCIAGESPFEIGLLPVKLLARMIELGKEVL